MAGSKTGCCPEGSWGELKKDQQDYKCKGVVETIAETDLQVYRVSGPDAAVAGRCIIWNYDVFGFDGGRTRQMADLVADHGFMVLIPDYFRGKVYDVTKLPMEELLAAFKEETWEKKLKDDWEKALLPYAKKHGAKSFGTTGCCWGTYPVMCLSTYDEVKAGVSFHPSHPFVAKTLGLSEEDMYKGVKCPQLFMPAKEDAESVQEGGLGSQILKDRLTVLAFPQMRHGWTMRGDLSDPKVEEDVKKAFTEAVAFFNQHL